jgi:L-aspartate oxidase
MQQVITDFLVIGSGVAGLRAAIELASYGDVLVVTKDIPTESSTEYAQGGVAVALSDEDEVGIHFEDTIRAGDGLCNEEAVKVLVEEGPKRILELIDWGAEFDKEGLKLSFTMEAAHSRKRILHAHGDSTGREIERVLINKVMQLGNVRRIQFCTAVDLIIEDNRCLGLYAVKEERAKVEHLLIFSKATVLATGGAGQIYIRTTNPAVATGDGMAIAYRAGALLEDMEFVQFHPTVLFSPPAPQFLLSEAMRGEGALLRNIKGEAFMKNYHPDGELAPRDIVSRSIISEMVRTQSSHVYLDLTHLDPDFLRKRFPRIYSTCLQYNFDITRDLIPVSPAAHYIMGGVKTDINGATSIEGLYAAGEVACTGVHGANRLASNSLLEGLVFGYRAGAAAAELRSQKREVRTQSVEVAANNPDFNIGKVRQELRRLMWEKVGIIRCAESLGIAKQRISQWKPIMDVCFYKRDELELKNMLIVALMITSAALERKNSVGAHYRSDFKERSGDWKRHLKIVKAPDGMKVF